MHKRGQRRGLEGRIWGIYRGLFDWLVQGMKEMTFMTGFRIIISIGMIIEPEFPQSFCRFLSAIIARQLQTDRARAKLQESASKSLFACLDSTNSGGIFLEDIYVFLKKKGVNLSKKELKFVNRYFGFSRCEKLSLNDFQACFFQIRDPKNVKVEKEGDQVQTLIDFFEVVLEGYGEIEKERLTAARDAQELRLCLCKFYKDDAGVISSQLLKEALYSMRLYSRLNFALLHHYVIGEEVKEITLKQLFATQSSPTETPVVPSIELKENKKLSIGFTSTPTETKAPGSFKLKSESTDILLQIQNIESAIKQKKDLYTQRKKMLEEECKKPVGMLVKRPSQTDIKPTLRERPQNYALDLVDATKSKFYQQQERLEDSEPVITGLSEQSKQKYSFADAIEQRKDFDSQDVDELLRSRMSSKTREETLHKASSCARLKIQEIERRVMGRVGQRAAATRAQEYVSRIPSDLHMKSNELRSRYSSLNRN